MSDRVSQLIDIFFGMDNDQLELQALSVETLTDQFGTPCFLYDQSVIENRLSDLRRAFGPEFSIFYSMKANPDQRIVRFLADQADGIEVASIGEAQAALECGCAPENIIFAGPAKLESELRAAIKLGIGEIHAESLTELERLEKIGRELNRHIKVCIRINPAEQNQGGAMRMGGLAAPFGIDEEEVPAVLKVTQSLPHIAVQGIHLFAGTQILDAATLLDQYDRFVELAVDVGQLLNLPLKSIDFGGGLGVPYFANEKELDLDKIRAGIGRVINKAQKEPVTRDARLMIEPGRFLTAESGIYVSRVVDVKRSRGTQFVILDGGMNHHLAASGNLGQVIKRNFPIACVNKLGQDHDHEYEIVGPLCTPLDRLGRKAKLPPIGVGDLVGIFCSGAYGRSASPNDFLGHPRPAEVWIADGMATVSQKERVGDA